MSNASKHDSEACYLIADIGGSNSRLALARHGKVIGQGLYCNSHYTDPLALIDDYLNQLNPDEYPEVAVLAVAGPVINRCVTLTNIAWQLDADELASTFGLRTVRLLNDFVAQALAIPVLEECDWVSIGEPVNEAEGAVGILGPGTGLGVSGLIPAGASWSWIEGEGGNITLSASSDEEAEIIALARTLHGHVSAECFLSGNGILELYRLLASRERIDVIHSEPEVIMAAAAKDPLCQKVMDHFFAILGSVAGNLALTLGARGGIYLAGGILPNFVDALRGSRFRECFVAKGRYRDYLCSIPTRLIICEHPALRGLAHGIHNQIVR